MRALAGLKLWQGPEDAASPTALAAAHPVLGEGACSDGMVFTWQALKMENLDKYMVEVSKKLHFL